MFSKYNSIDELIKYADDKEEKNHQKMIMSFFEKNPKPDDEKDIHSMADKLGIDKHKFEETIYELLGSFLGSGKSKDFKGEYDEEELRMGIEVEMEHTSNRFIAERIAKDHLAEFPHYYTALKKMEEELKRKSE